MTILTEAQLAIANWGEVLANRDAILNYLKQGSYFILSRLDYQTWKESVGTTEDASLHAYLGLSTLPTSTNYSLSLYCVDSATDSLPVAGNENAYILNLKKSWYSDGSGDDITAHNIDAADEVTLEALKSIFRWDLGKSNWVNAAIETNRMVQVFHIPFNDLRVLFDNDSSVDFIIVVFALKDTGDNTSDIDLILWGYNQATQSIAHDPQDIIKPCPPFGQKKGNYQLYNSVFPNS